MNQGQKHLLARFRRKSEPYDCHKDEGGRVFNALLDERIELNEQAQAQADDAPFPSPLAFSNSPAAAMNVDDDGEGKEGSFYVNAGNTILLPIRPKPKDEQAENGNEDQDVRYPHSTTPSGGPPAPDSTPIPTAPTTSTTSVPLIAPSGTPIYFFHGNINIPPVFIHADIQAAVQQLIQMYIARNQLASDVNVCINQRYDGQATDDADGLGYACRACIDKYRNGEHYKGYRVCIRHGQKTMGGQTVTAYFAHAQRRTRDSQYVWRSESNKDGEEG